jgi:hypothetical protein
MRDLYELTLDYYGDLDTLCEEYEIDPVIVVMFLFREGLIELVEPPMSGEEEEDDIT